MSDMNKLADVLERQGTLLEALTQAMAETTRTLEQVAVRLLDEPTETLDFVDEEHEARTLFVKDRGESLWHFWNPNAPEGQRHEYVPQTRLRCLVTGLRTYRKESEGYADRMKLRVEVRSARVSEIESGLDSAFSRGLLAQLATAGNGTPEVLRRPVVIEVQKGSKENVVLCQFYADGERVVAPPYSDVSTERLLRGARRALGLPEEDAAAGVDAEAAPQAAQKPAERRRARLQPQEDR